MKTIPKALLLTVLLTGAITARGAESDEKAETKADAKAEPVKITPGKDGESILTLAAETQKRIGLETASPAAAQWQPELRVTGRVADPLALAAAAADLESARAAVELSQHELERTQKLAGQDNASARTLEAAQSAARRDRLALQSAQAKFAGDWGGRFAARTNLAEWAEAFSGGQSALVRLNLPMGTALATPPATAKIFPTSGGANAVDAAFADDLGMDAASQMQQLLFTADGAKLPRGAAVIATLKTPGEPLRGVVIPAGAILRHEGKGSVFVQTGETSFSRREIPLDRAVDGGFFTAELSPTNRVVVTGAQTLLSAELSGGGFNAGQRD